MSESLADLAPLPLSGVVRPLAVDYDPVDKMVYWTDIDSVPSAQIARAHLDGSNQMTIVNDLHGKLSLQCLHGVAGQGMGGGGQLTKCEHHDISKFN